MKNPVNAEGTVATRLTGMLAHRQGSCQYYTSNLVLCQGAISLSLPCDLGYQCSGR